MQYLRLAELRERRGLTQKDVAQRLMMNVEVYRRYEKGLREIPVWALIRLAQVYDTTTDYLLGLSDEPRRHA